LSALSGKEDFALGVQCNMWTETCNDIDEVEYCLLPRMLAVSEIGWLPTSKKDWTSFYRRLQTHDEIFDLLDYQYAKHFIEPKEYTEQESTILEAEDILAKSVRGGVGYPSAEVYDALKNALESTDGEDVSALAQAISDYKSTEVVQPQEGKTYQIVSASTYYKRQYEGSTMYQKGSGVRFHFTPQTEPEELWQFVATDGGYLLKNLCTGKFVKMGSYNTALEMVENGGTPIRMDKATIATKNFTYIPGVVTLSSVSGYSDKMTGKVKRFSAELSGEVYAKDEAALCYNGTWKVVEIVDFSAQLKGIVNKCELILITAQPGEMGNYTQEALDFAEQSIILPAQKALAEGAISEEKYNEFLALYNQFIQMPKVSISQSLSEEYYYYIRNVWFGKYAQYKGSDKSVGISSSKSEDDTYLWRIKKNTDGTVFIYSKKTQTAAYLTSNAVDQKVKVGKDYAWTLEERTLDGKSGVCIIDGSGNFSWYTNPDVWNYVLMKPFWGACTWEFQQSGIEVPTGIDEVKTENGKGKTEIFDLSGRRVSTQTTSGVYIVGDKIIIK
ncbi:MAG: family 20 glycosylhydrolase, partial [Bacteroidaceae bacterium]|nr:family 20 glycosylhydrolase [Bacteroidaceae bacterium]